MRISEKNLAVYAGLPKGTVEGENQYMILMVTCYKRENICNYYYLIFK